MLLISFEINLMLNCSKDRITSGRIEVTKFAVDDIKLYIPVVTLTRQRKAIRSSITWI